MKPIDEYAEQANRAVGRYYGHRLIFGHDLRPYVRCQDWFKEHWRRFPWTSPDGGKTIDNEAPALQSHCNSIAPPNDALKPRIIEP